MQYLHTDFTIVGVHGIGDLLVARYIFFSDQFLSIGMSATLSVGANAASHNKANAAFGALTKISRHTLMAVGHFFKAGVH